MITLLSLSFWLYFILFFIAVFFAFVIPGTLLLRKLKLPVFDMFVLGTITGMVLWGWQGFIFGYLGTRWLSYPYLIITLLFWIYLNIKNLSSFINKFKPNGFDWRLTLIIVIGMIIQLSAVWFNGLLSVKGLYFCCGNFTDNLLHVALTNQLVKNFPPYEPGMSGVIVQNYHYWGNLIIAELIRVFKLPLIATQFQYSTLFISLFLGLSVVVFGRIAKLSRQFNLWLLFFLYFGGDLIFLLVSYIRKEVNFNMSSLEDGAKFLVNPPRAFSIVIFFVGISLFILWIRKKDLHSGLLAVFILGSITGFKVYTGMFVLSGFIFLAGYFLIKRNLYAIIMLAAVFIFSLIIYLPVNANAGGLYFTGLAIFENFIVQPWMMLYRLELARVIYLEHHSWLRVAEYELIYIFIFIFTVFGTKLIGIFQTKKSLGLLPKELNIVIIGGIIVSAIIGFFFQQQLGGANTFNFLVSIFIIGSIYTALACDYWFSKIKNKLKFFVVILIIVLTVPRVIDEGISNINNITSNKGFIIDNNELEALNYLREKTDKKSLILVDYRGAVIDARSPYVSFLSDRPMFLSGMDADLTTHGVNFSTRKSVVDVVLKSKDILSVAKSLQQNKINYIYQLWPYDISTIESIYFTKVYQGKGVTIIKVSQEAINSYINSNKKFQ